MSQENVEIVRAVIDAFNRGDWEAALKHAAPDFEFDFSRAVGPVRGVFKLDQIRAFLDEFFGLWDAVRFEVDEFIEVGEQVAMSFNNYHRGRDGIEVRCALPACGRFATGRPCVPASIKSGRRPSKPWGCASRRECQRQRRQPFSSWTHWWPQTERNSENLRAPQRTSAQLRAPHRTPVAVIAPRRSSVRVRLAP